MIVSQNKYVYNQVNPMQREMLRKKEFLVYTYECRDIDRWTTDDHVVLSID